MAIHIDTITGGDMVVSPSSHYPAATRIWWTEPRSGKMKSRSGEYSDVSIMGTLSQASVDNVDGHERTDMVAIEIGNDVTDIGKNAFQDCENLTTISIPNTINGIGENAFQNCTNIARVKIRDNGGENDVKQMIIDAIDDDTILEGINWEEPEDYEEPITPVISRTKFTLADDSTEEYDIEGSLNDVWMEENGFQDEDSEGNTVWNKDIVKVEIGEGIDEIGAFAFYSGDVCSAPVTGDGKAYALENLTSVTIPSTVEHIRTEAFSGCCALESIEIPNSVLDIGNDAFRDCEGMTNASIGNGVTHIGQRAFSGCGALASLTIGNSVVAIGESAFFGCHELQSICLPSTVQVIGFGTFDDCGNLSEIDMPSFTKAQVCANSGYWGLPDDCVVTCSNGTYTVGGEKPEADEDVEPEATQEQMTKFTLLDNGNEITETYNIRGIWNDKWNRDNDFQDYDTLQWIKTIKGIEVGTNVTEIGDFALYDESRESGQTGMGQFASIRIPTSVTKIGPWSFSNCTALLDISIPDSVVEIGDSAFTDCYGLASATIGSGVEYVGPRAFKDCHALVEISFTGENLKSIGNAAFRGCESLTTVNIPDGTTYIGGYAFYECPSLQLLEIPASVKYIGKNAFLGSNLTSMDVLGFTMEQVNEKAEVWGIPKGCKVACSDGSTIIGEEA